MNEFFLDHKKRVLIIFLLLIIAGFYLRSYHLTYPVIGYHNWKEVHYLSEARNFAREGFFQHGFLVPEYDYPDILANENAKSGAHPDTFPLPQIIIALFFKIFGASAPLARFLNILAGVGIIPLAYLIGRRLFHKPVWGYTLAALTTINPLLVFFSRNVQLDSIGFLLALLATHSYLQWSETRTAKNLFLTATWLTLATLTKYTFLIIIVPMITSAPWKEFYHQFLENKKSFLKKNIPPLLPLLLVPLWLYYEQIVLKGKLGGGIGTDFTYDYSVLFTPTFRATMNAYIADNYTTIGWYIALAGMIIFLFIYYSKKEKTFTERYLIGALAALPLYLVLAVNKLSGHNYHQYPITLFVLLFIAYIAVITGETLKQYTKRWYILTGILLIIILAPSSIEAKNRMFDTQFPALEVAGEYIKSHSNADEVVYFPSHQSYGVLWHADRKGLKTPQTLELFKKGEQEYNVQWLYLYQWGLALPQNEKLWNYVKNNYHVEQATFQTADNNQAMPIALLFQRRGNYSDEDLNKLLKTRTPTTTTYEYSRGIQELKTVSKN